MDNKLNIFISTHKDFICNISDNNVYKIITGKNCLHNSYNLDIIIEDEKSKLLNLHDLYGDISRIIYAANNIEIPEYIGFCHYRRYWDLTNLNVNDLQNYDVILCKNKIPIGNLYYNYGEYHIKISIDQMLEIIKNKYVDLYNKIINKNLLNDFYIYPHSMFITSKEIFIKYVKILEDVMNEFCELNNFNNIDDVKKYIQNNGRTDVDYQIKIISYLSERFTHLYFKALYDNIGELPVIIYDK